MTQRAIEQIEQLQGVLGPDIDTTRRFRDLLDEAEHHGATVYWGFWTPDELATPVRDL